MTRSGASRDKVLTISDPPVAGGRPGSDADGRPRYRAATAVHGHLHIPRTTGEDCVRFEEVSLGSPTERDMDDRRGEPRAILPAGAPS